MKTIKITKNILFCELKKQYISIEKDVKAAIERVLSSGRYILGEEVENFEKEFSSFCGSTYGIGVSSGTEALFLSLLACGVTPGDEVITVANAGVPPICAIEMTGATCVLVDSERDSYNIDPAKIAARITHKTKAIIPVHLYGQCADMDSIRSLARKHRLCVIEDACQAHGAVYKGKRVGSMGELGCFSFYPTKNLGAYGDGGMVVTSNKALKEKLRMLRDYGQKTRYKNVIKGVNSRLDEMQAAILRVKLKRLESWNKMRRELAKIYDTNIHSEFVSTPVRMEYGEHAYHIYAICSGKRDALKQYLEKMGVHTIVHYPGPIYMQKAYQNLKKKNTCPVSEKLAKSVLSLPLYPEIREEDVLYASEAINSFKG